MAKVKKSGKSHYELLFIVPNNFTEDEAGAIFEKVKTVIVDNEGEITLEENWGKRRLAYPINHFNHGYYGLMEFNLETAALTKIDRALRMSSEIMRHQIIKKKIKSAEQIEKDKKIAEKIAAENVKKEEERKEQEAKKEVKKQEEAKTKDEKKMDLKDLDEKLDKILETDNLL